MNFPGSLPLLGTWLCHRYVNQLTRNLADGDTTAICELCNIMIDSEEFLLRDTAARALENLQDPESIQIFLEEVLVRNNVTLNRLASAHLAHPCCEDLKALFFFVTGDRERYRALDPEPHYHLARGYARNGRRVREAVARAAKAYSTTGVLAKVLHGNALHDPPVMTPGEWEILINGFIEEKNWHRLWGLVLSAPVSLSVIALQAIRTSGWKPAGNDSELWEMLMQTLPAAWMHPSPCNDPLLTIGSGDGLITSHAFSPGGTLLATGSCYGQVKIFQVRSGALITTLDTGKAGVNFLAFPADKRSLVTGDDRATFRSWAFRTGEILWTYIPAERGSCHPVISPGGQFLVISDTPDRLTVLSLNDGIPLRTLSGFPSPVTFTVVSADRGDIFAGCADGSVCIVAPDAEQAVMLLKGRGDPVRALGPGAGGESVIVISDTSPPVLVDISGNIVRRFTGHTGKVAHAAFSADGYMVAIADSGRRLNIWRDANAAPVRSLPVYAKRVTALRFTPDGSSLITGYTNGSVRLTGIRGSGFEWEHKGHRKGVTSLGIPADGSLLFSTGPDRTAKLWDTVTGRPERTLARGTGGVTGLALLDNGNSIAAGYSGGDISLYRSDTGEKMRSLPRYSQTTGVVASNISGTLLAFAGGDNPLCIWDPAEDRVTICEGLRAQPRCLSFVPGEDLLITGGWDGRVRLWDTPEGTLRDTFAGHTSIVTSCAASPDGTILATGSNDRTVRIWSCGSRRMLRVMRDSRTEVGAVTFSPDGCYLVAGGSDGIIRVYTVPGGTPDRNIPAFTGPVTSLAFTPDGRTLVAGYGTGTLVFLEWATSRIIRTVHAHSGLVAGIVSAPGGKRMVTGGQDGFLRIWTLPLTATLAEMTMEDIATVSGFEQASPPGKDREQWTFLRTILSARFSEIELCPDPAGSGSSDIQLVG